MRDKKRNRHSNFHLPIFPRRSAPRRRHTYCSLRMEDKSILKRFVFIHSFEKKILGKTISVFVSIYLSISPLSFLQFSFSLFFGGNCAGKSKQWERESFERHFLVLSSFIFFCLVCSFVIQIELELDKWRERKRERNSGHAWTLHQNSNFDQASISASSWMLLLQKKEKARRLLVQEFFKRKFWLPLIFTLLSWNSTEETRLHKYFLYLRCFPS